MDIDKLLERVVDKASFLEFAEALRKEREDDEKLEETNPSHPSDHTAMGWQNTTIESFLEAAIAWARDTNFGEERLPNVPQWRLFAQFLYCGKIYE